MFLVLMLKNNLAKLKMTLIVSLVRLLIYLLMFIFLQVKLIILIKKSKNSFVLYFDVNYDLL